MPDLQYAFYHVPATSGLRGWQWMMITVALISFTASIITWFFLPDSPTRARFLTEEEKKKFVERVRRNDQGIKQKVFKRAQAIEALKDPFSWMLFMLAVNQTLVVGGINTFNALLINKAFNFSVTDSQLLSIPLGAMVIITYQLMA
jgi:sugar phosphate permease